MQGSRDYIKYLKRGYSRVSQINAFNVRNKRMTTEDAKIINEKYDGRKPPLWIFFEHVGLLRKNLMKLLIKQLFHQTNQL